MHCTTIATAILAALQAVVQQAAPVAAPAKPFFTDDLTGWFKLAAMYSAALGTVVAVMVKLAYNAHTEKVRVLSNDVDGVGKKVETNSTAIAASVAAIAQLTTRVTVVEESENRHERELGEHDVKLTTFERTQHQLQSDIMAAIRETGGAMQGELHALNIKVARFEERERFGEAMGEIASALRLMAKNQQN